MLPYTTQFRACEQLTRNNMNSEHIKAALIVYELYGKDSVTEADRKLAACMSFVRFFRGQPGFDQRMFYDICMHGTIVEAA